MTARYFGSTLAFLVCTNGVWKASSSRLTFLSPRPGHTNNCSSVTCLNTHRGHATVSSHHRQQPCTPGAQTRAVASCPSKTDNTDSIYQVALLRYVKHMGHGIGPTVHAGCQPAVGAAPGRCCAGYQSSPRTRGSI